MLTPVCKRKPIISETHAAVITDLAGALEISMDRLETLYHDLKAGREWTHGQVIDLLGKLSTLEDRVFYLLMVQSVCAETEKRP